MKIIKTTDFENFGLGDKEIIFEIPSSMRTISMRSCLLPLLRCYHLCLPRMQFAVSIRIGPPFELCFQGVFLSGDGEVYPMMLPNIYTDGFICLGLDGSSINKIVYDKERRLLPDDVIADNIYSNFIQSEFTCYGGVMSYFFENDSRYNKNKRYNDCYNDFYTEWSSRGRNYDICSDVRVKSYRDVLFGEKKPYWYVERFHVSLPVMGFMSYGSYLDSLFILRSLKGVFLDRDGEVYPMILPNVDIIGGICLGDMQRHYRGNLDVITDEIYSRFIQSYFTHNHNDFIKFFMYDDVISHAMLCDKIKEFYTEWSSKSRNYDICSDVSVKKYRAWWFRNNYIDSRQIAINGWRDMFGF